MANVVFIEEQKFRHNVLWTLALSTPLLFFSTVLIYQMYTGVSVGEHPMSNLSLVILIICYGAPVVFIIFYVRLITVISDESIVFGWNVPTKELNEVRLQDISSCQVIEYGFVGWLIS